MIYMCRTLKYYPTKVKGGFVLTRTNQPQRSLGFATFRTQKVAIHMGEIWYGKFLGYDKLSFPNKIKLRWNKKDYKKVPDAIRENTKYLFVGSLNRKGKIYIPK